MNGRALAFSTRTGILNPIQLQPRQRKPTCQYSVRLGVTLCTPHKPVQLAAQYGALSIVPDRCAALAYPALVHRQATIHIACVAAVTLRVQQTLQQAQECDFTPGSHLKVLPPIASVHLPARIARIATSNAHICPHLVKRYDLITPTYRCCRALRFQRRHCISSQ